MASRVVSHFSCGAASAVATKLTLAKYGHERVVIYNAYVDEEHEDNRRFLRDCETWFCHPVNVIRDEVYGASAREIWKRKRFLNNAFGAPCSILLKRGMIDPLCLPDDLHVFGFTVDANDLKRAARFDRLWAEFPLIDRNLTHNDCLEMVRRAGIELPMMYRLGYNNANCIGCIKGGEGYWNRIRRDFPARFDEIVQIQESIGPGAYLFRNRKTGERFGLKDLNPAAGRHDEPLPSCSFFCEEAESEF